MSFLELALTVAGVFLLVAGVVTLAWYALLEILELLERWRDRR